MASPLARELIASGRPRESGGTPGRVARRTTLQYQGRPADRRWLVTYITNTIRRTQNPNHTPTSTVPSMSYAGPASRARGSAGRQDPSATSPTRSLRPSEAAAARRPTASASEADEEPHETDWRRLAIFGAGLALGLTLGAGAALLVAPQSGEETRSALRSRARRLSRATGRRGQDAWDDLRDELRSAARSVRRRRARRAARKALQVELEREAVAD